ncbi:hypothetical protein B1R32_10312 [Abditibacterium utsteinense]|uniref:Uncharacterized protein n=1 Tax=Abditibacterium utsteinense TaxID=1960156 RepID=A0A2S8SVC5_9BACT|nr:hypothetical protein [Abditibacterium utsteinense]PQV64745.1 hypothetical protein B1R32_10312 [Abditibacterium utsteinense]
MRQLKIIWLLSIGVPLALSCDVFTTKAAFAQNDVRIVYPQQGQDVRGEITARFEGIPAGGYATVKIDGQFRQASAQDFAVLDTLSDRVAFARGDGTYTMEIIVMNAGGKRVGTSSVTFNVANNKVDPGGAPVRLVHWTHDDRINGGVQRFRVFAESNATISGGTAAGGLGAGGSSGGSSGGGLGGSSGGASEIPAPLDFQVAALMRRVLRDTNMLNGSANISTIVQEGFERQREGAGGGAGGASTSLVSASPSRKKGAATTAVGKAPWSADWLAAPETGKFFVKMIQQNGTEINATRKAPSLAIADLLPTFPDVAVRPGSTWGTTMSFVGDLSSRTPINVKDAPMTFTAYEDLQTPGGENRRCAKLESRFRLPDNLAKRIAANLANKVGTSGGAAGGGEGGSSGGPSMGGSPLGSSQGGGAEASALTEDDITVARTDVARVIWFDVQRRRILRAEDVIRSNFEIPVAETAAGGISSQGMSRSAGSGSGMLGMSGEAGAEAAPAEPQKVDYSLNVTTWIDDRVPNPTGQYVPGGAGAHTRDSVAEPGLSRILRANTPER